MTNVEPDHLKYWGTAEAMTAGFHDFATAIGRSGKDIAKMIGRIGTILGESGINIGNMAVGRGEPGERAAMAITVDDPVPEGVINRTSKPQASPTLAP